MSYHLDLHSLDELALRLPFGLDACADVNIAYTAHLRAPTTESAKLVDLWTYCFIRRYYLMKFIRESRFQSCELESVIDQTYKKVERGRKRLKQNDRYAQWVSVVCKNNFINFVTRRSHVITLDAMEMISDVEGSAVETMPESEWVDPSVGAGMLYVALTRAIDDLPVFLRHIARMRFVEQLSYEEIGRLTGHSLATVRAYIHKVCTRFRKDAGLREFRTWYE
jgi:RNA polymerase sigma factor (sigma-70 family)